MKIYPLMEMHRKIIVQRLDSKLEAMGGRAMITKVSECHICGRKETSWNHESKEKNVPDRRCPHCGGIIVTRTAADLE